MQRIDDPIPFSTSGYFNRLEQRIEEVEQHYKRFKKDLYSLKYRARDEVEQLLKIVRAIRFTWQPNRNRFIFRIYAHEGVHRLVESVSLTRQAATMLGYESIGPFHDYVEADFEPDLQGGVSHLVIYLNGGLMESTIFGNQITNLLQVVGVDRREARSVVEKDFQSPIFHRVLCKECDVIDVEIRSMTGRLVPFEGGITILTLQFKKFINF